MNYSANQFERFLRRLRRRSWLVRTAERVGLCAAVACGGAWLLELLLIWRGQAAWPVCLTALAAGCLTGLTWGIASPPSRLEAAIEADTQLHLSDLLGTAWSILSAKGSKTDAWQQIIVSQAEARSRQTSPAQVWFNRWGGRAWGGVGLAAVLAVAFAFVPTHAARSQTGEATVSFSPKDSHDNDLSDHDGLVADTFPVTGRPVGSRPDDEVGTKTQENEPPSDNTAGTGSGTSANTHALMHSNTNPHPTSPSGNAGNPGGPHDSAGGTSGGTTSATGQAGGSTGPSDAANNHGGRPIAPWHTLDWPRNQADALSAIDSGQIPDRYRTLVRAYFERSGD